jgi:3-hydroxyisobutyrate dehydrogenase-like beta-hydroxyacid dehydrogenase
VRSEVRGKATGDDQEEIPGQVDIVITSLPDSYVVNDVVESSLRLFETGKTGLLLNDTTTADPMMLEALALRLKKMGMEMLDATISGTSKMCAAKDVTMMVGGQEDMFRYEGHGLREFNQPLRLEEVEVPKIGEKCLPKIWKEKGYGEISSG